MIPLKRLLILDESEMNNRKFLTEENELYFSFKGKCFSSLSPSQKFTAHKRQSICLSSMAPSYHHALRRHLENEKHFESPNNRY